MPQVGCNRTNPHLVVPHLIVRTPLPTGTAPVNMGHIDTLNSLIAAWSLRIDNLEDWREDTVDPALASLEERMTDVEVGITPVGAVMMWPTATPPARWLLCDGTEYDAEDYPDLAALIGTGGLTFTVPDFRDRFPKAPTAPGDVLDEFEASTAAPVSVTAIPTTGGSTSHRHTFTTKAAGAQALTVTVASGNAVHGHGAATGSSGTHGHTADPVAYHQHALGAYDGGEGTPMIAYPKSMFEGLGPYPYATHVDMYTNLWLREYGATGDEVAYIAAYAADAGGTGLPHWSSAWKSGQGGAHTPSINTVGNHTHSIENDNTTHGHAGSTVSSVADHTHIGETEYGPVTHQHNVDKTKGWDTETRPKGFMINFIIRY